MEKYIKLAKIAAITVGTVYGGHLLVQYVTPTEEELLAVRKCLVHKFKYFYKFY